MFQSYYARCSFPLGRVGLGPGGGFRIFDFVFQDAVCSPALVLRCHAYVCAQNAVNSASSGEQHQAAITHCPAI